MEAFDYIRRFLILDTCIKRNSTKKEILCKYEEYLNKEFCISTVEKDLHLMRTFFETPIICIRIQGEEYKKFNHRIFIYKYKEDFCLKKEIKLYLGLE